MRRGELIVNLASVFGAPVIANVIIVGALLLAPFRIPGMLVCFALYAAGLSLLLAAKMPLFRRRIWVSFGPSQMSRGSRARYIVAYALLVSGVTLNLLLLFSTIVPG